MTTTVTVTSKRQITLPKDFMESLGIEKGDKLVAKKVGKKVTLEPKGRGVLDMVGKFGNLKVPKGKTVDDLIEESMYSNEKDLLS